MSKSSDEIRQEIERDRQDAAEKIDHLEEQLQDTADHMKHQAQGAVTDIRDEAQEMVHDAVDSVKETLDFRQQVEERPLLSVATALVGGYVLGSMMDDDGGGGQSSGSGIGQSLRNSAQESGLFETLENFAAALVGSVTDEVKGAVKPTK